MGAQVFSHGARKLFLIYEASSLWQEGELPGAREDSEETTCLRGGLVIGTACRAVEEGDTACPLTQSGRPGPSPAPLCDTGKEEGGEICRRVSK